METNILQFLGGGAFTYIIFKDLILPFLSKKTNVNGEASKETINLLREIKEVNVKSGDKLESINRNMMIMLERQSNIEKRVDEIRNLN